MLRVPVRAPTPEVDLADSNSHGNSYGNSYGTGCRVGAWIAGHNLSHHAAAILNSHDGPAPCLPMVRPRRSISCASGATKVQLKADGAPRAMNGQQMIGSLDESSQHSDMA